MVPVTKDKEAECPIPSSWRSVFCEIVDCLADGDFSLSSGIPNVKPIDAGLADFIRESILAYGNTLVPISERTWTTSVCRWQGSDWIALVDLFTLEEGLSDLVLHAKVAELNGGFLFEVSSVHVP